MRAMLPAVLLLVSAHAAHSAALSVTAWPAATPSEAAGEPTVAADGDGGFVLSWQARLEDGETALRLRPIDRNGGAGDTVEAARGTGWFVNWADFPAVAVLANGDWLVHWLQRSGEGRYAYDIRSRRSSDRGRIWSSPLTVHDDGTQSEHGFVAYAPAGDDSAILVWLDGRHTAAATGIPRHGEHAQGHGAAGAMSLRAGRLTRAGMREAVELDDRVCDCCQTDAVRSGNRTLVVYRDRSDGEIRDVALVRHDGRRWSQPRTLFADGWTIAGCPVNGPAIAADGRHVIAAAYSEAGGEPALRVRSSADGGETWHAPVALAPGDARGRADVGALPDGQFLVVHQIADGDRVRLRVDLLSAEGTMRDSRVLARASASGLPGFPRLAVSAGRALVAWTEVHDRRPRVRLASLTVDMAQ